MWRALRPPRTPCCGKTGCARTSGADPFDSDTLLGNAPEREERFIVIPNVL